MRDAVIGVVITVFLALGASRADADVPRREPPGDSAAVDSLFRWATPSTPGCAVGVAREGRTLVARAYGRANLEHDAPNTTETVFETGSVAKQFTAAAVVLLARDGKLSLDDPVRRHVPELPAHAAAVTIRQLLHQTSGVPDWTSVTYIGGRALVGNFAYTNAHALDLVVRQRALNFAPGAEWLYSNSNYILAAVVVERVSGMSLPAFTRQRLFAPLGMAHTEWRDDYRRTVVGRATAYGPAGGGGFVQNMPFQHTYGPGGLLTTVGDLLKWNEALADGTVGGPVGGPRLAALMTTPARLADGRQVSYAFGLSVERHRGIPAVVHDGGTGGYRAYLARVPEQRLSVALLCNSAAVDPARLGRQVADVFLPAQAAAPVPAANGGAVLPSVPLTAAQLAAHAGLYRDTLMGTAVRADVRDSVLVLQNTGPMRALSPTTFVSASGAVRAEFTSDARSRTSLLRRTHQTDGTTVYARVEPWTPSAAELEALVGEYTSDEADGRYAVTVRDGALALRLSPTFAGPLTPTYRDAFTFGGWLLLRFQRDAGGAVTGLVASDVRVRAIPFVRRTP
ncbi:MAG: serine hydrolase domain-containing protein [Gemmatirosa sp.]